MTLPCPEARQHPPGAAAAHGRSNTELQGICTGVKRFDRSRKVNFARACNSSIPASRPAVTRPTPTQADRLRAHDYAAGDRSLQCAAAPKIVRPVYFTRSAWQVTPVTAVVLGWLPFSQPRTCATDKNARIPAPARYACRGLLTTDPSVAIVRTMSRKTTSAGRRFECAQRAPHRVSQISGALCP